MPCHLRSGFDQEDDGDAAVRRGCGECSCQARSACDTQLLVHTASSHPIPSHAGLNCTWHLIGMSTEADVDGARAITTIITRVIRTPIAAPLDSSKEMPTVAGTCSGLCLGWEYSTCLG